MKLFTYRKHLQNTKNCPNYDIELSFENILGF